MGNAIDIAKLGSVDPELPESVIAPRAAFKNTGEAIQYHLGKLEGIAHQKKVTLDELRERSNRYLYGPEESFFILGLFDTIRALKSSE